MPTFDSFNESTLLKSAASMRINPNDKFDIFLSHSYADKDIIPRLKKALEGFGFSVYVDWINDRLLSRDSVNKNTAKVLQQRMKQSRSLVYATSENSSNSRWMPWELGYFDGIKDKMVAILPLKKDTNGFTDDFSGQEYLGLYYYVDKATPKGSAKEILYINEDRATYTTFDAWLNQNQKPTKRSLDG